MKRRFPDKPINYVKNVEDLPKELYKVIKPDDMLITMGAGNIYIAGEMLANLMKGKGLSSDYKNNTVAVLMGGVSREADISRKQEQLFFRRCCLWGTMR